MTTTNVKAGDLSYDKKSDDYDRDIVAAIPGHGEVQSLIAKTAKNFFGGRSIKVLDLGVGTGLTSEVVRAVLPDAELTVVDFSSTMLEKARRKLGEGVEYVNADYSTWTPTRQYDLVTSFVGLHHQTDEGKKWVIRKVHQALNPGGIFLLGDLITHEDSRERALNDALHFHHMVEHSPDQETLRDWAHHHMCLNQPATIPQHISWMCEAGFERAETLFSKYNTALIMAVK